MDLPKDLVAASATPLVLAVLKRGDSYGYEIIKSIRLVSGGELEWKEGMLYPLLHRLAHQGLIEGYDAPAPGGRKRKYYRLLPAGGRHLETQQRHIDFIGSTLAALARPAQGGVHAVPG
jgi:DNA-binding PadR family transcriptional regulator